MAEHRNVKRIREGYAAFKKGDLEALRSLFAGDIVWHVPGDWELAGDYKGQDEVFSFFGNLLSRIDKLDQNLLDIFANDRRGVAVLETRMEVKGRSHMGIQAHIFEINDEGRVTEFWNCSYDQAGFQALFA